MWCRNAWLSKLTVRLGTRLCTLSVSHSAPAPAPFRPCAAHSKRVYSGYQSPKLREVQAEVKALKKRLKKKIAIAIFYGRERYVRILLPYIERNLAQNMGVVDEVILVTHNRDSDEGAIGAQRLLDDMVSRYPGVVREEPFCARPYGEWRGRHGQAPAGVHS